MIETKIRICEPDSPNRCQAIFSAGQCKYEAQPGYKNCSIHNLLESNAAAAKIIKQYNVAKWSARIGQFAEHEQVKGLREEIGIVRLLLETVLNQCGTDFDLLLYSNKISELVSKIESLVKSCHKLESSMGVLLDKTAALQLSGEIVEIINQHIKDEEIVNRISKGIAEALVRVEQRKLED